MLEFFVSNEQGYLTKIDKLNKGCWINIVNPTSEEVNLIVNEAGIERDFIRDALDEEERSRIEKEDDQTFIIVDSPMYNQTEGMYDTIPLGIVITNDHFITITLKENPVIQDFINNKIKSFFTFKKNRFVLQLLYRVATYYLKYLKEINRKSDEIEKELHQSMKNQELFHLLNLEKSLVFFTTSLKSNEVVIEKLLRAKFLTHYEEDQDILEDVLVEIKQAIEMSQIYSSILSGMMDAFASVISNNLNIVMKFLTSITIILSLPTMVASFYGMNVPLPFQNYTHAFTLAIILSVILSGVTAYIFAKKKLF